MFLIYPACETFVEPLPIFEFDQDLKLQVLPFDLETPPSSQQWRLPCR